MAKAPPVPPRLKRKAMRRSYANSRCSCAISRNGSRKSSSGSLSCSKAGTPPARAARSRPSPRRSVRASSASSHSLRHRTGKDADVHAALHAAFSVWRRNRHLRPQLVQSRRRRIRHGLLHRRRARSLPVALSANRAIRRGGRHHPDQALARGRHGGAGTALQGETRRSAPAMETEPDGYRVRIADGMPIRAPAT